MRDLDLNDEDEEGIETGTIHLEETEEPCRECGDEGCHLYDSHTTDRGSGEPDPQISLCSNCGPAHEAFYDAVREEEAEKEDAEDDEQKNAA